METLRVSPDQLMALAQELFDILQEKNKLNERLHNVLSDLNTSWEGRETVSLINRLGRLQTAECEERIVLEKLISLMVNRAELYQQAENELISSIKDLKIDEVV